MVTLVWPADNRDYPVMKSRAFLSGFYRLHLHLLESKSRAGAERPLAVLLLHDLRLITYLSDYKFKKILIAGYQVRVEDDALGKLARAGNIPPVNHGDAYAYHFVIFGTFGLKNRIIRQQVGRFRVWSGGDRN
jgi:hypothetical protein